MRHRFPVAATLAAGLLLIGCASDGEDGRPDLAAEDDTATDDTATGEDGEPMDGDHGGMMADADDHGSGTVGEPADARDAVRTIEVDAFDMAFDPQRIEVEPGEVVTFAVSNTGEAVHEFTLGDSAMQREHAEEMARDGHLHDGPNVVSLEPGESKELTWRFGEAGTVDYACHEPGHYDAGMHGEITIG